MALNPVAVTESMDDDFLRCQLTSYPLPAFSPGMGPSQPTLRHRQQIMVTSGEDDR